MGLFFPDDDDRHIPGVRKTGFPRYKELLGSWWKEFLLVGFLTLLFFIPFAAGTVYAILTRSALLALAAGLLGGLIAGPGYACLVDLFLRRLRNDKADWWVSWKRSMKQNWSASLLPGAVQCGMTGLVVFAGALMLWGASPITVGTLLLLAVSTVVGSMVLTVWWAQVVLFEQRQAARIKNAVFFCIFHFGKALTAGLLQVIWWALMVLLLPWTAFVVPVLGIWYVLFVSLNLLYPMLDEDFHIEEQIEEKFPGRMDE